MNQTRTMRGRRQGGFSLVELMVAMVIVSLASAIAVPVLQDATDKAKRNAMIADGKVLYDAFMAYHVDQGRFPSEFGPGSFDVQTLEPLASEGYFPVAQAFLGKLTRGQLMLYLAPDIGTRDAEFLAIARASYDPNVIVVIAHTGIIHAAGQFLDGVYLIDDGQLKEAGELN
jgi:prepilin-type N-terminal cleavage/methylation domain-containing protein